MLPAVLTAPTTVASTSYLAPTITASATVLAAIIGGFLAAALKHRWDMKDTQAQWDRERAERRREELRAAFNEYLTNRAEILTLLELPPKQFTQSQATNLLMFSRRTVSYFTQLKVMLEAPDMAIIQADTGALDEWINASFAAADPSNEGTSVEIPVAPSDEPVRQLAYRILNP
jgi:hypothetical protein